MNLYGEAQLVVLFGIILGKHTSILAQAPPRDTKCQWRSAGGLTRLTAPSPKWFELRAS